MDVQLAGMRLGATVEDAGVRFMVWAPEIQSVEVVREDRSAFALEKAKGGYHTGLFAGAGAGTRYKFRLDGGWPLPDPASRYQPNGPHEWSEVIDPGSYPWGATETDRAGIELRGQVIYELHIGTFTAEGTFLSAEREFRRLKDLGITVLEIMPLAEFGGTFGWGYDGVDLYAPFHHYGTPDDLRHMIEAAHQIGLAVILDVVYNHLGPVGNYLGQFASDYFSHRPTEWGDSINFDGENSGSVREFFLQNAEYWIRDFHFDGLRLDATQSINDSCSHGGAHILTELQQRARAAAGARKIIVVSECERQTSQQISPVEEGGFGLDGMWNDDLHHSAAVRLTGRREAYYTDHPGRPQEFISAAKYGFLYQGQFYSWQRSPRGTSFLEVPPWKMITFLENHDQVANSPRGMRPRADTSPAKYRAMCAYWLLSPGTPMFFMGQEWGSHHPFYYFADHEGDLREMVRKGRTEFLTQFDSVNTEMMQGCVPDPGDRSTFERSKLNYEERSRGQGHHLEHFFTDLLRLRREDPAIRQQKKGAVDGAVLTDDCFALRFFLNEAGNERADRLLIVNFGQTLDLKHIPEPLLAAPGGRSWNWGWASERPEYGGCGTVFPITESGWRIGGEQAILLIAQ